ncbi:hypothetical protein [Pseudomonas poae]|uniref:Uncharacterized protein n=1 Tax=Pseudomonas poae TaxID=200451 RepID=A0ABY0RBL8_9PSED|nr:hypothetical protein [Pseudomonas poae]KRP44110.1 hypothetical protein TU75_22830 [Pseudomonas poae]SDN52285.1 hypothetical protein SAMN04490208_0579 [Pseudomonas poae]
MKTHFFAGPGSGDIERAPCGTWLGEGSGLSGMWERVDCRRCQSLKEKIIDTAATEERAIVEQMGDMAAFMRAEDGKQEVTP